MQLTVHVLYAHINYTGSHYSFRDSETIKAAIVWLCVRVQEYLSWCLSLMCLRRQQTKANMTLALEYFDCNCDPRTYAFIRAGLINTFLSQFYNSHVRKYIKIKKLQIIRWISNLINCIIHHSNYFMKAYLFFLNVILAFFVIKMFNAMTSMHCNYHRSPVNQTVWPQCLYAKVLSWRSLSFCG